jgi:hypothetical protein
MVTFDFTMTQNLTALVDLAETPGIIGDTDIPDEIDITVEMTGELSYFINPADDPDEYEIAISGLVTDTTVTGLIDDQVVDDLDDLPADFAPDTSPPSLILIVDRTGAVTPRDPGPTDLFGIIANPASAASIGGINPLTDHLGPVFPDHPLSAAASWQTQTTQEILGSTTTITFDHQLSAVQNTDGREVATIETALSSDGFEISLGALLSLFFGGANDLADGAESGDVSSVFSGSGFDLTVTGSPLVGEATTEFDITSGRVLEYRTASDSPARITLSFPDEATGGTVSGLMEVTTTVDFTATRMTTEAGG